MISSPTAVTGEPAGANSQAASPAMTESGQSGDNAGDAGPAVRRHVGGPRTLIILGRDGLGAHLHKAILRPFPHAHNGIR